MKLRIAKEEIEKRTLFVATPMYGGQCCGAYVHGLLHLNTVMIQNGLAMKYYSLANESLVTRARNYCAREFLRSGFSHMLFIDSDIGFRADDAISLLALADPDSDKDVVCGVYPRKSIQWDKVAAAARRGVDDRNLASCGSPLPFNPIGAEVQYDTYEPFEVVNCGSGFMMIQRRVFERFAQEFPDRHYICDGLDNKDLEKGNIMAFFETTIDEHGRYLSEDYNFCRIVREMGMKVWVAPWLELHHLGHYRFTGNLQAQSVPAETAADAA